MQNCKLIVKDMVNIKFDGLDPIVRKELSDALRFTVPGAHFMPQVKLGRWDGTVSFCTGTSASYLNLLDRLLPVIDQHGYTVDLEDRRPIFDFQFPDVTEDLLADHVWPEGHELAGEPIMLRDYQVEAIRTFLANLQSVQEISMGAGKTIMCAALSWLCQRYGRSIIIVPSQSLVTQTEADYRALGLDVGVYYGKRKEWNHQHTICTWQALSMFATKTRRDEAEVPLDDFIKDVVCIMVDEAHTVKGSTLRELLTGSFAHLPIRWGLTGTIPPHEHERICLLAAIGPKVGEIKTSDLQELGVLADSKVDIIQLVDDHVEFKNYDDEHKFLLSDPCRLQQMAELIHLWSETGNTLVLVDRIEAGKNLQKLIPESVFISGETKDKVRTDEYKSVQWMNNKIIIATYGVLSIGVNIPRVFNVVFIEPGHSFIRVMQSLGRGLRKTKDKFVVQIFDLCSSLKFSKRHLSKRKLLYSAAKHPYTSQKVTYL